MSARIPFEAFEVTPSVVGPVMIRCDLTGGLAHTGREGGLLVLPPPFTPALGALLAKRLDKEMPPVFEPIPEPSTLWMIPLAAILLVNA